MNNFSDLFPPPKFLRMPAIGVDIGEEAIRCVEFGKSGGTLTLRQFGSKSLRQGTIKNGEILNAEELKRMLRGLRDEYRFEFAHLSLPEEKAYIFRTAVPLSDPEQIRDAIEFQLEENVPLSISEALFDYTILRNPGHDTDHLDVVVVVLPKQYVEEYANIIKSAGIFPLSLQIAPTAIAHAITPQKYLGTSMLIHFHREKTEIIIVSQGAVQFTSTIGIGGDALTASIEKHFGVSADEARKIKRGDVFIKNKEKVELFFSLMNTVSALKDEIYRLYIYWHTFKGRGDETGGKIERVVLCGDDALLPGFDEYLSIMLQTPVEVGNVWTNAFEFDDHVPQMKFNESLEYAAAIGLALADKF